MGTFLTVTEPGLTIDFDPTQMFTWTNTIVDMMLPVVYITAGLALGFLIINSLKRAFSY
jgi:hypothetical protein